MKNETFYKILNGSQIVNVKEGRPDGSILIILLKDGKNFDLVVKNGVIINDHTESCIDIPYERIK